jgi:hypothetical protein
MPVIEWVARTAFALRKDFNVATLTLSAKVLVSDGGPDNGSMLRTMQQSSILPSLRRSFCGRVVEEWML